MTNDLDFSSLRPNVVEGIKTPDGQLCVLHEPSAGDGIDFRKALQQAYKTDDEGNLIHLGSANAEILLLSRCLKTTDGHAIPENTIRSWPDRVARTLYTKLEEISDIGQPLTEEQLVKGIARMQKRLDRLRADKNGRPEKNPTTPCSAPPVA